MDLNLGGRSALITGGSKGIGLAIAKSLAAEGCHVHLAARTASELDKAADEIRKQHKVTATTHPADLTDSAQIKKLAAACRDEVSSMVAFLASDHAQYISGSAVTIDGGPLSDSAIGVRRG